MNDIRQEGFRPALSRFREAVHREGELSDIPRLYTILHGESRANGLRLRWAVAAVVMLALGAIPVYVNEQQRQREAAQEAADRALLQQVNAGLSRSVSRAMAPLAGWVSERRAPGN